MTGLRERLAARSLPTETVTFPADRARYDAVHVELQSAAAAVHQARRRGARDEELGPLVDAEAAAREAADAAEVLAWEVRTLPVHEWEALVSAYPAVQGAEHGWPYNPPTFHPALLAEVVSCDGEQLDADWWASPDGLAPGELMHLTNVALRLNANTSVVSEAVGKGSPQTPS